MALIALVAVMALPVSAHAQMPGVKSFVRCPARESFDGTLVERVSADILPQCESGRSAGFDDAVFGVHTDAWLGTQHVKTRVPWVADSVDARAKWLLEHNCARTDPDRKVLVVWDRVPGTEGADQCSLASIPRVRLYRVIWLDDEQATIDYMPAGVSVSRAELKTNGQRMLDTVVALAKGEAPYARARRDELAAQEYLDAHGLSKLLGKR
jgi:hypothetical protein